jgi:serine/threonine protein kinase
MARFTPAQIISAGLNSVVHHCVDNERGANRRAVAMKVITSKEAAFEESSRLLMVGHSNIISLLDIIECPDSVGIVMPLVHMDLRVFMKRFDYFSDTMLQIKLQTTRAVHHVHVRGLLHLDIKPENIGIDLLSEKGETVKCVLLDFGSSVVVEEACQSLCGGGSSAIAIQATRGYYPPELETGGIISSACDIYSTGVVFDELIANNQQGSDSLGLFRTLSADMQHANFRCRPSSKDVLVRLGDEEIRLPLLLVTRDNDHPAWTSPVASALRQCQHWHVADTFINDHHSSNLHKLVTLVRSADVGHIRDAFWLLFETSVEESDDGGSEGSSVLSILHYFDSRIHLSRENSFFYAKSLDVLSRLPYFVLNDDMKLHLWKVTSVSCACERPVLRCLAGCWVADDTLLDWCSDSRKRWGMRQELFSAFASRFTNDWDTHSAAAAKRVLGCA